MPFSLTVNGERHTIDVDEDAPLLWVIRDEIGLTGTKFGCGVAQCGACTVFMNGNPTRSCVTPVTAADGAEIVTIEGIASGEQLHPVQAAFVACDGFQCGFCTPGQIMSAIGLMCEGQAGDDPERIREGMSGNLCRCGAYAGIVDAVLEAQASQTEAKQRRSA